MRCFLKQFTKNRNNVYTQPINMIMKGSQVRHLSRAIVHLLSMKSVAASNVAGQANAVSRVLKTVIIAPCFINSIATPSSSQKRSIKVLKRTFWNTMETKLNYSNRLKPITWSNPILNCSANSNQILRFPLDCIPKNLAGGKSQHNWVLGVSSTLHWD